jgi:hypothetical protein
MRKGPKCLRERIVFPGKKGKGGIIPKRVIIIGNNKEA